MRKRQNKKSYKTCVKILDKNTLHFPQHKRHAGASQSRIGASVCFPLLSHWQYNTLKTRIRADTILTIAYK